MDRIALILIIDDNASVRGLLHDILQQAGYDVAEACDGAAGLRVHRRVCADLIITDVFMEQKDGLETIRDLRNQADGVKILAISGGYHGVDLDVLDIAKKLGANAVLDKPFDIPLLLNTVNDLLGRNDRPFNFLGFPAQSSPLTQLLRTVEA